MKFCTACGKQLDDTAAFCHHCGTACGQPAAPQQPVAQQPAPQAAPQKPAPAANDAPSFAMALVGFLVPILGLILWILNKDTKPKEAASAGKGALVSVICGVIFYILYFVFIFVMAFGMGAF